MIAFRLVYFVTIFSAVKSVNVIYHLNDTEYLRMPPVIRREEYADCPQYCAVDALLLPHTNSDLYDLIVHYSNREKTHYNHTKIRHGICVPKTCKNILTLTTTGLRESLEACLNETFTKQYGLRVNVTKVICNDEYGKMQSLDKADIVMLTIIMALVILNVVGSLQEVLIKKEERRNKFLSCFGLQRNLDILFAERKLSDHEAELKAIYGIRFLTMVLILLGHVTLLVPFTDTGSHLREKSYEIEQYLVGGTIIVHSFFVISAFLITHSLLQLGDKITLKPSAIPIFILKKWLRLTPLYLFVYGLTATLLRFAISNPLAQLLIANIVSDCRRDWWMILLYIINYSDHSQCMFEAWFISTDFYLSILAVTVVVLLQGKKRIGALIILFCTGLATSGYHTYTEDLDGMLQPSPENMLRSLEDYPTFHSVYKRTHTNVSSYVVGMVTAMIIFHMQKHGINRHDSVALRIFFCALVPLGAIIIVAGMVFYLEGPRLWLGIRVAWAMFHKTIFAAGIGTVIIAQHLRLGGLLNMLRWRLWIAPARLSYCVYMVNILIIRFIIAIFTTLPYKSTLELYAYGVIVLITFYIISVPFWLFIEAPSVNFSKLVMNKVLQKTKKKMEEDNKKNVEVSVITTP